MPCNIADAATIPQQVRTLNVAGKETPIGRRKTERQVGQRDRRGPSYHLHAATGLHAWHQRQEGLASEEDDKHRQAHYMSTFSYSLLQPATMHVRGVDRKQEIRGCHERSRLMFRLFTSESLAHVSHSYHVGSFKWASGDVTPLLAVAPDSLYSRDTVDLPNGRAAHMKVKIEQAMPRRYSFFSSSRAEGLRQPPTGLTDKLETFFDVCI